MSRTGKSCLLCVVLGLVLCGLAVWAAWLATGRGAPAYRLLAWHSEDRGDYPRAVRYWRKAVRGQPKDADLRHDLASALQQVGRKQDALAQHREAVRLDPKHLDSWLAIYILSWDSNNARESMHALREAKRLADAQPNIDPALRQAIDGCARQNAELMALYEKLDRAEARIAQLRGDTARLEKQREDLDTRIGAACALLGEALEKRGDQAGAAREYQAGAAHGDAPCKQRLAELKQTPPIPLSASKAFR